MFLERLGGVFAGFPPGKPFTLAGFILRPALRGEGDIEPAVAIEIAGAEIMAQAWRVFLGEDIPFPALGGLGILGDIQPHGGVGELAHGLAAVGE